MKYEKCVVCGLSFPEGDLDATYSTCKGDCSAKFELAMSEPAWEFSEDENCCMPTGEQPVELTPSQVYELGCKGCSGAECAECSEHNMRDEEGIPF